MCWCCCFLVYLCVLPDYFSQMKISKPFYKVDLNINSLLFVSYLRFCILLFWYFCSVCLNAKIVPNRCMFIVVYTLLQTMNVIVCLPACLPARPSVCLSVCLSVCSKSPVMLRVNQTVQLSIYTNHGHLGSYNVFFINLSFLRVTSHSHNT